MHEESFEHERDYELARTDERAWRLARSLGMTRRSFLVWAGLTIAGAAAINVRARAAAGQAPTPILKPTPPDMFVDFGTNKEMRWENLHGRGYVVPNEQFFVRNHSRTPRIDPSTYRLRIEGSGVSRPREFTYDEILDLPATSVIRAVECAGNGRSFFEEAYGRRAQGTQWRLGAIGVAEWTGIPLRELLDRCGVKSSARDVMPEGMDDLRVRRPIPISKAVAEDTLLVFAMNGQTLPPDHGFPLRLLVPGWIGVASVKWVGRIEVSETPLLSPWNTTSYVLVGSGYRPNPPHDGPVLSVQGVKSAFELPWGGEVRGGLRTLRGRSWSGAGRIAKVDVSLDRGITWRPARLREPNIPQAWVRWDLDWDAGPGAYGLRARATDERGNTQAAGVPFNEQGYLYTAVVTHPVSVR